MSDITIQPVGGDAQLKRFIRLPSRLYADDPHFVPPLEMERLDALRAGKNPWFEHGEAQFFLAVRDGRDVGRISAQVDRLEEILAGRRKAAAPPVRLPPIQPLFQRLRARMSARGSRFR